MLINPVIRSRTHHFRCEYPLTRDNILVFLFSSLVKPWRYETYSVLLRIVHNISNISSHICVKIILKINLVPGWRHMKEVNFLFYSKEIKQTVFIYLYICLSIRRYLVRKFWKHFHVTLTALDVVRRIYFWFILAQYFSYFTWNSQ
jgi:hypothetical protein